jgi:hypothetical protein
MQDRLRFGNAVAASRLINDGFPTTPGRRRNSQKLRRHTVDGCLRAIRATNHERIGLYLF